MHKNRAIVLRLTILSLSYKHSRPIPSTVNDEIIINDVSFAPRTEKPVHRLNLLATGDNLFHEPIIRTYRQNNSYNFTPIYAEVNDIIENADLAFVNQETVMGGEEFGYSGFPTFNTPQALAKNLADTGFDIVNHANNHAMDMGRRGLEATLDLWDSVPGITVLGARKSGERHKIITKNNITLGFLSYTQSLNGFVLPADNPNLVSLINRRRMEEEIAALKPLCDFLIVSVHWGDEYRLVEPGPDQISLARFLADQNVDLIIGHHPHVLQRVESLSRPDGKETLCFYSLGNFVSNQREKERILGGMMLVTFLKKDDELSISVSGLIPVVCHFDQGFANTRVYPLYSYTEELLQKHLVRIMDRDMTFDFFYSVLNRLETKIIMHNPLQKNQLSLIE